MTDKKEEMDRDALALEKLVESHERLAGAMEKIAEAMMHMAQTSRENIAGALSSIAEYHEQYVRFGESMVKLYEHSVQQSAR